MSKDFPQYRKLSNNKSLYKIVSALHLQELQLLGTRWYMHELHARILPERNLILDLLATHEGYEACTEEEFGDAHAQWLSSAKK